MNYPSLEIESPNVKLVTNENEELVLESHYEYNNVRVQRQPNNSIKVSALSSAALCFSLAKFHLHKSSLRRNRK